jgi:hypothetical protein
VIYITGRFIVLGHGSANIDMRILDFTFYVLRVTSEVSGPECGGALRRGFLRGEETVL